MSFDLKLKDRDIVIGSNGDLQKVEDSEKLIQDLLKIAITPLGANPLFPSYGCLISKSLAGAVIDSNITSSVASSQLRTAIETLQNLQKVQMGTQRVSPAELIASIKNVSVLRNQIDPRFYRIFISVISRALTEENTNFDISL